MKEKVPFIRGLLLRIEDRFCDIKEGFMPANFGVLAHLFFEFDKTLRGDFEEISCAKSFG